MTMREIQDLTLDLARGADRLDAIFRERASGFEEWWQRASGENGACRITAVPLGGFPGLPRLSGDPNEFPVRTRFRANYGADVDLTGPSFGGFRQIVRGSRRYEQDNDSARLDIFESGLIDLWYRHQPTGSRHHFFIGWLLGACLSVLDAIGTARSMANVPEWDFAIELRLTERPEQHELAVERFLWADYPSAGLVAPTGRRKSKNSRSGFPAFPTETSATVRLSCKWC
jgi:hypothetical protein